METEQNWNGHGSPREGGAEDIGEKARNTAEQARSQVRSLAESGREQLASQLGGIGRALRNAGDQLRGEEKGQVGYYSEMLGQQAERISSYLSEHDAEELIGRVETFARKQPLIFLGGCLAAGFVIGRFFKASGGGEELPLGVSGEPAPLAEPSVGETVPTGAESIVSGPRAESVRTESVITEIPGGEITPSTVITPGEER